MIEIEPRTDTFIPWAISQHEASQCGAQSKSGDKLGSGD